MSFGTKLKILLDIYCIKSRKFANVIHIDPSSISRWLNNKRVPDQNSEITDKLIDFFLNYEGLAFQRKRFLDLILPKEHVNAENSIQLPRLLKEWLYSPSNDNSSIQSTQNVFESYTNAVHINDFLFNIGIKTETSVSTPSEIEKSSACFDLNPGDPRDTELFYGNEGIRQALLHLLFYLFQTDAPGELYIISQDLSFWYSDMNSHMVLSNMIKKILQKGHKIKLIINLNFRLPELMHIIKDLITLYSTANLEVYYFTKYMENPLSMNFFVVPGYGSAFSIMSDTNNTFGCTFLYRNFGISEFFKNRFEMLLLSSRPLIYIYTKKNILSLQEEVASIEETNGCRFVYKNGLTSLTIPYSLYEKLLNKIDISETQKQKRLSLHKLRLETLKSGISTYIDICPIRAIENMINPNGYEYFLIDIFSSGVVKSELTDVLQHLRNTLEILKECNNYEIILIGENSIFDDKTMYWALKEDNAVIISTWNDQGEPYSVVIKESTVMNAFEEYFMNILNKISPINRNKEWVISKLQSKIQKLENYLNQAQ